MIHVLLHRLSYYITKGWFGGWNLEFVQKCMSGADGLWAGAFFLAYISFVIVLCTGSPQ